MRRSDAPPPPEEMVSVTPPIVDAPAAFDHPFFLAEAILREVLLSLEREARYAARAFEARARAFEAGARVFEDSLRDPIINLLRRFIAARLAQPERPTLFEAVWASQQSPTPGLGSYYRYTGGSAPPPPGPGDHKDYPFTGSLTCEICNSPLQYTLDHSEGDFLVAAEGIPAHVVDGLPSRDASRAELTLLKLELAEGTP